MSSLIPDPASILRGRLRSGERLLGSFIKTPTVHATEILGGLGFDFVVIDEEHAPIDRGKTELILLAARAAGIAALVRVPGVSRILGALDDGAAGVLVPHVSSAAAAREAVAACRYRGGRRGFSNSPRAGAYGALSMWAHVERQDASTAVIAMIEDPEALKDIDAIVATDGLDGIFIGRADLAVAIGAPSAGAPQIRSAVERVCVAAGRAGLPVCLMVADADEARSCLPLGVSAFVVASDQAFMRRAASDALHAFAPLRPA